MRKSRNEPRTGLGKLPKGSRRILESYRVVTNHIRRRRGRADSIPDYPIAYTPPYLDGKQGYLSSLQ